MYPHRLLLSVALSLLAATALHAQPLTPPAKPEPPTPVKPPATVQAKQMYEDIEIMRRLLPRGLHRWQTASCTSCHAHPFTDISPSLAFSLDGKLLAQRIDEAVVRLWDANTGKQLSACPAHGVLPAAVAADGVYLKGQGVVFTLTLPSLPVQPSHPKTPPTPKSVLSDWELMRKQVRGEDDKTPAPTARRQPDLAEALLKILADNGHHFSQLGAKETLTVVVTFRDDGRGVQYSRAVVQIPHVAVKKPLTFGQKPGSTDKLTKPEIKNAESARELELLADLQLKQNKVEEAVELYLQVLKQKPPQPSALYSKLVRAYLMLEDQAKQEEVRARALERAAHYLKMIETARGDPARTSATPRATPLQSRLIVSAPKELLHAYAAGTVSFDSFRQQATVEWLHFSAAEDKTTSVPK